MGKVKCSSEEPKNKWHELLSVQFKILCRILWKYLCEMGIQSCTNEAPGYMGPRALRVQNFTGDVLEKSLIIFFKRTSIGNALVYGLQFFILLVQEMYGCPE
jgi:hypothetical protein